MAKEKKQIPEGTEELLMGSLLNEPSDPKDVLGYKLVFQRPPRKDKHKGLVWSKKQIKALELDGIEEEANDLIWYYTNYGELGIATTEITDPNGKKVTFDPAQHWCVFDKVASDLYDQGHTEEEFVIPAILAYFEWINSVTIVGKEEDIKNSSKPTDGEQ